MRVYFELSRGTSGRDDLNDLVTFDDGRTLRIAGDRTEVVVGPSRRLFLFGDVFYSRRDDGSIRTTSADDSEHLAQLFARHSPEEVAELLEGQYVAVVVDDAAREVQVVLDRYARLDLFVRSSGDTLRFSNDVGEVLAGESPERDQRMLAHLFLVYGWYTPKGTTIYSDVTRLRVGESVAISSGGGVSRRQAEFVPLRIEEYGSDDLERYYQVLRDSVLARAARSGTTWVSASSGWDSSLLVGILANELGPSSVGMLTGSMHYSPQTDVINRFEIDKVGRIAEFFGIKPEIVRFDYTTAAAGDIMRGLAPFCRSRQLYTLSSLNMTRLAEGLTSVAGPGCTIMNGEASDSFHNFGFSQFGTFFHTSKAFTEYADKMNCYLFGPSFLGKVLDGSFEGDRVFRIFREMSPGVPFRTDWPDRAGMLEAFLFPLFYGGPRLPFAETWHTPVLTDAGRAAVYTYPFREYMPEALAGITPETIYSWYIRMYLSFHTQGSTVAVLRAAMERSGQSSRMPYNDARLIEVLSKAPESWGRGLDLNHTKYPLKWVAENRIPFPYETLQEGPHAYLYDTIEGFSLAAETTYRSGLSHLFREVMDEAAYRDVLDPDYFDLAYLDGLRDGYLAGSEVKGADLGALFALVQFCIIGWY